MRDTDKAHEQAYLATRPRQISDVYGGDGMIHQTKLSVSATTATSTPCHVPGDPFLHRLPRDMPFAQYFHKVLGLDPPGTGA
jgi:hypothetical protein